MSTVSIEPRRAETRLLDLSKRAQRNDNLYHSARKTGKARGPAGAPPLKVTAGQTGPLDPGTTLGQSAPVRPEQSVRPDRRMRATIEGHTGRRSQGATRRGPATGAARALVCEALCSCSCQNCGSSEGVRPPRRQGSMNPVSSGWASGPPDRARRSDQISRVPSASLKKNAAAEFNGSGICPALPLFP